MLARLGSCQLESHPVGHKRGPRDSFKERLHLNAYMNIQIRVASTQANRQVQQLQSQLNGLSRAGSGVSGVFAGMIGSRALSPLTKFGNQLQWTGRQLQYNFTLPLALATAAAAKFSLENEKAFTRMVKVYGDFSMSQQQVTNETNALRKAFVALSNHFGVAQKDVLDVAAAWAAAGASGLALAQDVKLTMETMILGEMNATEATDALIAIQAQYNQSTAELTKTIQILNMVENQTGISLQGLVQGFARAAGTAAMAGIDVRHLAAMLAAMTPAAGSAAQAGNALKTIISRLFAPTQDAVDVMGKMGINVNSVGWQSKNGAQRIETLAQKFSQLNGAQKSAVSSIIASRFQLNKFGVLMDSVATKVNGVTTQTSYYKRALESTASDQAVFLQMQKELNQVLSSNPQRLKQIWTILQNAMADIVQPMIPIILMAADVLRRMAEGFQKLPPEIQKFIGMAALMIAIFGPLIRYIGSTIVLLSELSWVFGMILTPFKLVFSGFSGLTRLLGGAFFGAATIASRALVGMTGAIGFLLGGLGKMAAGFLSFVGTVAGPALAFMGQAMSAAFIALGNRLVLIWTSTFATMRAVTVASGSALVAAFRIVPAAMFLTGMAMWRTLTAIWTIGSAGLLAITRGLYLTSALLTQGFLVSMTAMMTRGWLAIVGAARFGVFGILALIRGLPALILSSGPAIFAALRALGTGALAALTGPWGVAIAAVLTVIWFFRKQIQQVISNVIDDFNKLPAGMVGALGAVISIVRTAALKVYEWLQWMNPFARHSPSLVDNVTAGMAIVRKEFASVRGVAGPIEQAGRDLQKFGRIIAQLKAQMTAAQAASDRANLGKVNPGALAAFDALTRDLANLNRALVSAKAAVDAQQAVVNRWSARLDSANAILDKQKSKLDSLTDKLNRYKDELAAAQERLQTFANTPIKGMGAMEDAIFNNEMAQKKLRLEMLKMEDVIGPIDQVQGRLSKLNGELELAQGMSNSLRAKGAGSDILSVYNDQAKAIEGQKKAINDTLKPYNELSDALSNLQRQGEILDLTKSLQFDPLTRQIEKAANAMKELPFDVIMKGIQDSKADIDKWSAAVDAATKAVEAQQKIVDAATAARDAISARYDTEAAKLEKLKDRYGEVQDAISSVEDALRSMTGAAEDALRRQEQAAGKTLSPAMKAFNAGAMAKDFAKVTGSGGLGRQGGAGDQSALIDQFTKDMAKQTADMFDKFDMFGPVKRKWKEFTTWLKGIWGPVKDFVSKAFGGVDFMAPFRKLDFSKLKGIKDTFVDIFQTIGGWGKKAWDLLGPDIIAIGKNLWAGIQDIWKQVSPELEKFKELVKPVVDALSNAWKIIKPILGLVLGAVLGLASILLHTLAGVIKPVFEAIGGILAGFLSVVRGVIRVVAGIFTLDMAQIMKGLGEIFGGTWKAIISLLKGAIKVIVEIVKGLVTGIWNFFKWLWDVLVGHSIIPDIINGIWKWFKILIGIPKWVYDNMLRPIFDKFAGWWKDSLSPKVAAIKDGVVGFFHKLGDLPKWIFDNALKPMYDKFVSIWDTYLKPLGNRMLRGFANIFNNVGKAIAFGINIGVDAVNKLIDGLNWIGSHVPGLSFSIGKIGSASVNFWTPPQFAKGGSLPFPAGKVGGGFKTNGIRAIVGEGNRNHPEFVIPTDPKYKKRAIGLVAQAAREIGIGFESGGILGKIKGAIASQGSDLLRGAVNKVMNPIVGAANNMLNRVDNRMYLRDLMKAQVRTIASFGKMIDSALPKADGGFNPRLSKALEWAKSQSGKPYIWGAVGPNGYDCSGFMSAVTNYVLGDPLFQRRFATGNFPTAGWIKGPGAFMIGSRRGNPGHMAGTMNGTNIESSGGVGVHYGASARGARDGLFGGNIWHLKGYMAGGRIGDPAFDLLSPRGQRYLGPGWRRFARRATYDNGGTLYPGYTLAYNGTGRPERVLTARQAEKSGGNTYNFGDLSFPNVKNGDDAKDFIRNLEILTGGR